MVDWDLATTWDTFNVTVTNAVPLEDVCRDDVIKNKFVITDRTSYDAFKGYCDVLDGMLPIPENMDMLQAIHDQVVPKLYAYVRTYRYGSACLAVCVLNRSMLPFVLFPPPPRHLPASSLPRRSCST